MLEPMHKVGCIGPKHILKEQALREYCPGKTFMLHFSPIYFEVKRVTGRQLSLRPGHHLDPAVAF